MLISMNWISEYTDLSGINLKELIGRFTLSTAEVEDIYELGKDISDVVVGEIVEITPHPSSKKLHLLKINTGADIVPCVCGAPNVAVGAYVAFAKAGGKVKGKEILATTVAGYESYGMCCSEQELGISEDNSGLLLFDSSHKPGTNIKDFLPLEDTIFEVDNKSLTNRPDLWGHYGIAREIATLTKRSLKPVETLELTKYESLPAIPIHIEAPEKVFRYSCIRVDHVTKHESPLTMKIRLTYCGMRPINLLADLTNYLMLELGQPMHAFDSDVLFGNRPDDNNITTGITVKTFEQPFDFVTLDGVTRNIDTDTLMICSNQGPAAIAGIMGGELSQIQDTTSSLMLESANFDAVSVRTSAVRIGLRTDASAHYEKCLDPEMTVPAIGRFLKLLTAIDPSVIVTSSLSDLYIKKYDTITIDFDKKYVDKYTGIDISSDAIEETLTLLGFQVTRENDSFHVVVPSYRATKDVTMKADIIEEITRIYGYDNFELNSQMSLIQPVRQLPSHIEEYDIKLLLAKKYNMNEVHTYLWYDNRKNKELGIQTAPNIRIINSITGDNATIQSSVLPNLLNTVSRNVNRYPEQRIFTISRVADGYTADGLCIEKKKLGLIFASKKKEEKELYFELKALLDNLMYELKNDLPAYQPHSESNTCNNYLHPVNTADILMGQKVLGILSCLHPMVQKQLDRKLNVVMAELDLDLVHQQSSSEYTYQEPSKYPEISIDYSLLMPVKMPYKELDSLIHTCCLKNLKSYEFIDQYLDKDVLGDKKSITLRFTFSSNERTLESSEITAETDRLIELLKTNGILLR